jgi:hypothetical protein
MVRHNPEASQHQQDIVTGAIEAMVDSAQAFILASIVEEALVNSSGMKTPIKCFGCDDIRKYDCQSYHMWRNCPNKGDKQVWENFQVNLKWF